MHLGYLSTIPSAVVLSYARGRSVGTQTLRRKTGTANLAEEMNLASAFGADVLTCIVGLRAVFTASTSTTALMNVMLLARQLQQTHPGPLMW